jgi:predicted  nucleic acid-binding Zn-ribbon protein
MKQCERCGYTRKKPKKVATAGCPRCGYKKPSFFTRLSLAWTAFQAKPSNYTVRPKEAKQVTPEQGGIND